MNASKFLTIVMFSVVACIEGWMQWHNIAIPGWLTMIGMGLGVGVPSPVFAAPPAPALPPPASPPSA